MKQPAKAPAEAAPKTLDVLVDISDLAIGHRVAQASVLCFVGDLLEQIHSELPQPS